MVVTTSVAPGYGVIGPSKPPGEPPGKVLKFSKETKYRASVERYDQGGPRAEDLRSGRFVAIDIETNGWADARLRIVEIGAAEVVDGKLTGREYSGLVKPDPVEGAELNPTWVAKCPAFVDRLAEAKERGDALTDVLDACLRFCADDTVVCYGAFNGQPADDFFLKSDMERIGYAGRLKEVRNIMYLASGLMRTDLPRLPAWCDFSMVPLLKPHDSLEDARATAHCIVRYFEYSLLVNRGG